MESKTLIKLLSQKLPKNLANDLVSDFLELRIEAIQGNLGKTTSGKFIETVVQVLQFIDSGTFEVKPKVDLFLKNIENQQTNLDDGLKLCVSRASRSVYSIRSKRGVAHKSNLDQNVIDLRYVYSSCQWIITEIIRQILSNIDIKAANSIISAIQKPLSYLTEEFEDRKIIYGGYSAKEEILIILNESFPDYLKSDYIKKSLDRRAPSTVINALRELWKNKQIHKDPQNQDNYKITQEGIRFITQKIKNHQ